MSGLKLVVNQQDINAAQQVFAALNAKELDMRVPFNALAQYIVSKITKKFNKNLIKPPSKSAQKDGRATLVLSGILRDSLTFEASDQDLALGSNKPYAAIHQFGGKAGRNHSVTLEARPYLEWEEDYQEEAKHLVMEWLQDEINKRVK